MVLPRLAKLHAHVVQRARVRRGEVQEPIEFREDPERDEYAPLADGAEKMAREVAEAPWSAAEWAVALRFDNPRATVLVLVLGCQFWGSKHRKRM